MEVGRASGWLPWFRLGLIYRLLNDWNRVGNDGLMDGLVHMYFLTVAAMAAVTAAAAMAAITAEAISPSLGSITSIVVFIAMGAELRSIPSVSYAAVAFASFQLVQGLQVGRLAQAQY